jgi:hypothetical protein
VLTIRLREFDDPRLLKLAVHSQIKIATVLGALGRLRQSIAACEKVYQLGEPALAAFEEVARDTAQKGGRRHATS